MDRQLDLLGDQTRTHHSSSSWVALSRECVTVVNPKGWRQLVQAIHSAAAVGIRSKLGSLEWQYSLARKLAAIAQCDGMYCEHVL